MTGLSNQIGPKRRVDFTPSGKPTTHGKRRTYNRGCRCEECYSAQAKYNSESKKLRVQRAQEGTVDVPHGTAGAYVNYDCRCLKCTEAWSAKCAGEARKRAQGYKRKYRDPDVLERARLRRLKEVELGRRRVVHGTLNAYTNYKCRCAGCTTASREYDQEYVRKKREEEKK